MDIINQSYVYDQLKASLSVFSVLEDSCKAASSYFGYKQKAPIHKPAFPQDSNKVGWQGTQ